MALKALTPVRSDSPPPGEEAKTTHLTICSHPLLAHLDRRFVADPPLRGESVDAYLTRQGVDRRGAWLLTHNGRAVPAKAWARTEVRHGDVLVIRRLPEGGDDGKNPVVTIFSLVLLAVAPYLSPWIRFAVTVVGLYAINELFPPPGLDLSQQADSQAKDSPTYSIAGGRNRLRPGQPLPIVFGTHRLVPDLGAQPYTRFNSVVLGGGFTIPQVLSSNTQQILHQVFNFGLSDVTLSDFKIGNTPVANFSHLTIEESGADGVLNSFPTNVDTDVFNVEMNNAAGWVVRTTALNTTMIDIDITGQLYKFSTSSGRMLDHSVVFEFEYRVVGSGTWLSWHPLGIGPAGSMVTLKGGHYGQVFRCTLSIENLEPAQYEVRLRRPGTDDTESIQVSDLFWTALRSYQPDTVSYAGQKRVAVTIIASAQLAGAIDEFSAVATANQRIPQEGGGTETGATSNPAWCFYNAARGRFDASNRRLWGGGLAEARLDMDALHDWAAFCTANDLRCDIVFDTHLTVSDMLRMIAYTGRASSTWASGKLGTVWDAANQPNTALYSMNNIRAGSFRVSYVSEALADELVGVFLNSEQDYILDEVSVLAPGVTSPVRTARIELRGITRESQAAREVNLLIARNEYQRRRISWETDIEGMVNTRGDVVTLSHNLTRWGTSARVVSATATTVTLSREVTIDDAEDNHLLLCEPSGGMSTHEVTNASGTTATLTLAADMTTVVNSLGDNVRIPGDAADNPARDTKVCYAPEATPGKRVKIINIEPVDEFYLRLTAIDETPDFYAAENGDYNHTTPPDYVGRTPTVSNVEFHEQLVTPDGLTQVTITWVLDGAAEVLLVIALDGLSNNLGRIAGSQHVITVPTATVIDVTLRPFVLAGVKGSNVQTVTASHTVVGKFNPPSDVQDFIARQVGALVNLAWSLISDIDRDGYVIKFGPVGVAWENAEFLTREARGTGFTTASLPDGTHDVLIKAIDGSKLESLNAARSTVSVISNYDIIDAKQHNPAWAGATLENFYVHCSGKLYPRSQGTAADFGWDTFDVFVPDPYDTYRVELPEHVLGFDDVARVWLEKVTGRGPGESANAEFLTEVDYHLDGGSYDGWEPWVVGELPVKNVKFRVSMFAGDGQGLGYIESCRTVVDQVEHELLLEEQAIAPGGTTIVFDPPFHLQPHVDSITPKSSTGRFGNWDNLTATQGEFFLFDGSGNDVGGVTNIKLRGV